MSTIVVVKKDGDAVIAADTLTTCGNTKESAEYIVNHEKIFKYKGNYVGVSGSATLQIAVEDILSRSRQNIVLGNTADIFRFGLSLHKSLKEEYFLLADDEEDFETLRGDLLIANQNGIFGLSSYRFVQEYSKFYANGSGFEYALGAMFTVYKDNEKSAQDIAEIGVKAGIEFDNNSASPISFHTLKLI